MVESRKNDIRPEISVIMSVHNGRDYVEQSIQSILNQTFTNFEFLILDDGSNDETTSILRKYILEDHRIVLFKNVENIGLTKSLNILLKSAKGRFLARIDADDVSHPNRLEKQRNYLLENPEIALLATNCDIVDKDFNYLYTHCPPSNPTALNWSLVFRNPFRHSTMMWNRNSIQGEEYYDTNFVYTQDYDLWQRIGMSSRVAVLPESLASIRTHEKTISHLQVDTQDELVTQVVKRQIEFYLGKKVSFEEAKRMRYMYVHRHSKQIEEMKKIPPKEFKKTIKLYLELAEVFRKNKTCDYGMLCYEVTGDIKSTLKTHKALLTPLCQEIFDEDQEIKKLIQSSVRRFFLL